MTRAKNTTSDLQRQKIMKPEDQAHSYPPSLPPCSVHVTASWRNGTVARESHLSSGPCHEHCINVCCFVYYKHIGM